MLPRIRPRFGLLLALWSLSLDHWGATTASTASSSSWMGGDAPWQAGEDRRSILEESLYRERPPTTFSPTGRLHPVERILERTKDPISNLVLALRCKDGILVFSTLSTSPFLNTTTNNTLFSFGPDQEEEPAQGGSTLPIVTLSRKLVGATAGHPLDGQILRNKLHAFADQFLQEDDEEEESRTQASEMARMLADHLQVPTQNMQARGGPMLAVR